MLRFGDKAPAVTRKKKQGVEEPRVQPPYIIARVPRQVPAEYWEDKQWEYVLKMQDQKPYKEIIVLWLKSMSEAGCHREALLFLSGKSMDHDKWIERAKADIRRHRDAVSPKLRGDSRKVPGNTGTKVPRVHVRKQDLQSGRKRTASLFGDARVGTRKTASRNRKG